MNAPAKPELSVLVPVRNEEMNLRIFLRFLRVSLPWPHEVLVIHDTLDDKSVPVVLQEQAAYPGLRLVHNQLGRGAFNAVRAGVQAAAAPIACIQCADDTGPVLVIEDMMELMRQGCDFVSITRYAHGGRRLGGSLIGGCLSRTANWLFHLLVRSPFTDSTTGGKMFRREIFERLRLTSPPVGWAFAFEMAIKAQFLGIPLGEVPLVSIDRLFGGESTFRVAAWVRVYSRWFLWGARETWRRRAWRRSPIRVRVPVFYQPKG